MWMTDLREARRHTKLRDDHSDRTEQPLRKGGRWPKQQQQPQQPLPACHPGSHDSRYAALHIPEWETPISRVENQTEVAERNRNRNHSYSPSSCRWLEVARDPGRAVNHVVSLNQYQVLSTGINDRMDIWDVRRGFHQPYTRFPGYRNRARVGRVGLAVDKTLGIVAAANDHGPDAFCPVKLHSLATGMELPCGVLRDEMSHLPSAGDLTAAAVLGIPSPCLRWERLQGDRDSSLFISRGAHVFKYTFGMETGLVDEFDDEPLVS